MAAAAQKTPKKVDPATHVQKEVPDGVLRGGVGVGVGVGGSCR